MTRLTGVGLNLVLAVLALSIAAAALACQREHTDVAEPTAVINAASPTPEPTRERDRLVMTRYPSNCEASGYDPPPTHHRHFIQWSQDDSMLIFDFHEAVWVLTLEDSQLRKIVEATPGVYPMLGLGPVFNFYPEEAPAWAQSGFGIHAHLSPDGKRIAYSSCQYDWLGSRSPGKERVGYEIATINIDGTDQRRLTDNEFLDHFPVWSPDGTRLAHVCCGFEVERCCIESDDEWTSLTVRPLGGVSQADGPPEFIGAGLYPPVWSPDGTRIAFVYQQQPTGRELRSLRRTRFRNIVHNPNPQFIYIIDADGTDPVRIAEASTPPTWSPDSREVAFAHNNATSAESAIYVAGADGTDIRSIWSGDFEEPFPIKRVSWSPDGSELLVVSGHLWAIGTDGNGARQLATSTLQVAPGKANRDSDGSLWIPGPLLNTRIKGRQDGSPIPRLDLDDAVWSSDGSRIAVYAWGRDRVPASFRIMTMARDGTDVRMVVKVDADRGVIHAPEQPRNENKVDATP